MSEFNFIQSKEIIGDDTDGVFFFVSPNISKSAELFFDYGKGLMAPGGYFGKNWDAFNDCVMDLQWIKSTNIHIVHSDLPIFSDRELAIYLSVLNGSVIDWKSEKTDDMLGSFPEFIAHKIFIYFLNEDQRKVSSLI